KMKEALGQLTIAHGEAVGNYNLGYLLAKKDDKTAALEHFRKAVEKDPTLEPAREWVARLMLPQAPFGAQVAAAIADAKRPPATQAYAATRPSSQAVERFPESEAAANVTVVPPTAPTRYLTPQAPPAGQVVAPPPSVPPAMSGAIQLPAPPAANPALV